MCCAIANIFSVIRKGKSPRMETNVLSIVMSLSSCCFQFEIRLALRRKSNKGRQITYRTERFLRSVLLFKKTQVNDAPKQTLSRYSKVSSLAFVLPTFFIAFTAANKSSLFSSLSPAVEMRLSSSRLKLKKLKEMSSSIDSLPVQVICAGIHLSVHRVGGVGRLLNIFEKLHIHVQPKLCDKSFTQV